jgi:lysophospholipase L1-like esterase
MNMLHARALALVLVLTSADAIAARPARLARLAQAPAPAAPGAHDFSQWEKSIAAFEASDRTAPPPKNGILFVGSSTIVRWKTLPQDFPGLPVINRGFGGNQIVDSTHFAERMIIPYAPRLIVLRAGGNDIHAGKSPEQVFGEFKDFVATVHGKLPKAEILYISQPPTIARWDEREALKKLNALIEAHVKTDRRLKYVETYDTTLDSKGQPRPELFVEDKLHFSPEGYKVMLERVRPAIR